MLMALCFYSGEKVSRFSRKVSEFLCHNSVARNPIQGKEFVPNLLAAALSGPEGGAFRVGEDPDSPGIIPRT